MERLPADQHRVVQVPTGKEEEVLQVLRREQPTPGARLRVRDVREDLVLHRGLHVR